jgi:proteasome lid subunit RPN8/RPN11
MDPLDELRAFRLMDERGWDLIGIYHSHPETEAYPSATDQARAFDEKSRPLFPGTCYMIVSLREPGDPQVRAFRLHGDGDGKTRVDPEDVVVT